MKMKVSEPTLLSFSHEYWSGKSDGMHRYSNEEWFKKYASELLAMLSSRGTLLDVGCGSCQVTTYLAPEFEQVYALDFSETMLAAARRRVQSFGLKNVQVCPGTAQEFPREIPRADIILSNGVLQYLTLADFSQHLRECRRALTSRGMVCAALIPNSNLRNLYYHDRLVPHRDHFVGRLRGWIELAHRRAKARIQRDLLWDGIGNWFCRAEIEEAAKEAGFEVEFRNSWFYEYRFHALMYPKPA